MRSQVFQIRKSISQQQDNVKQVLQDNNKKKSFNQLQYCTPYPSESSIYYRFTIIMLEFVFFISMILSFKFITSDSMFLGIELSTVKKIINSENIIGFAINVVIKLLIISNVCLQIILKNRQQQFKIIFSTIQKLKKFLRLLIQVDFQLSSLLLLNQSFGSIINLIISIVIVLFALIFLENYCEMKDRFYVNNFYFLFLFRLCLIFGALSTLLPLFVSSSALSFIIYHICASLVIMVVYLINGWIIYKDSLLRWSLLTFISLYFTIAINLLVYLYCTPKNGSFLIHLIITFIVVELSLYLRLKSQQIEVIGSHFNLQEKCFVIFNILQESYFQVQQKALIAALLKFHSFQNCKNEKCYTFLNEVYDSKKTKNCISKQFIDERASLAKFYLKCVFETYLQSHPKDNRIIISYCELLYWKFRNIGQTIYWLQILKNNMNYSSFGILIKFNGFFQIVQKSSRKNCELLYNKNLDIEHLIDAEEIFKSITSRINTILRQRLQAWRLVQQQQIDLSLIREKMQPTFANILSVSQDWKRISKYLKHCNKWKQQYLFFILYIKSEKIKNKVLEQFESTTQQNIDLHKFMKNCRNFDLKSLFSQDTCCINVYLSESKAFIKRVSNNFSIFTQYSSVEMINADINILLPNLSANYHQKIIDNMYKLGKFSDENLYKINEVYIVNKSGFLVPVYKIFKEFVNQNGELEYICFFKKAEVKQVIILCDQYYEIQNFTQNFFEDLQFSRLNSQFMKNINLLSMIPTLTQMSVFSSTQKQQFHYNSDLIGQKTLKSNDLLVKIQFPNEEHLSSMYLQYQNYLKEINKSNLAQYHKKIKLIQDQISQNCLQFDISLNINLKKNTQCKYYQIKINQAQLRKQIKNLRMREHTVLQKFRITSISTQTKKTNEKTIMREKRRSRNSDQNGENIFVKEQVNEAPHKNIYLQSLKYIWLLFLLTLGFISNTNLVILSFKYAQLETFSLKLGSIVQMTFTSSNLVTYYQSYLLNATTLQQVTPKIQTFTNNVQKSLNTKKFHQIIFDRQINTPYNYSPLVQSEQNNNLSYNEIDIVFFIQNLFRSCAAKSNITAYSTEYKQLINYYYPSFIDFANKTKRNLHQSFQTYIQQIQIQNTIVYSAQSLVFTGIVFITIFMSIKFFKAMFEMMKIHCQFNAQDIKKIIFYYNKTLNMFHTIQNQSNLNVQLENFNLSKRVSETKQRQQRGQNNNLNKKSKDISLGKKQINQSIAYIVKVALCLLFLIGYTFCQNAYLISLIKPIVNVQGYGYKQFLYSPNRIINSLIIGNQYIYSQEFVPKNNYNQIMSNTFIQKSTPYIAAPLYNTKFFTFLQNVYFTNLCQMFKNQMQKNGFTQSQCQTIAGSSFTRGIIAYSGYQYQRINKIYALHQDLTALQIKEYYRSLEYVRLFLTDLGTIWQQQFFNLCQWSLAVIKVLLIGSNVIILLVILLGFVSLFKYLEKQYKFYKQFYRNMMPQYIISEQKIIKSKLVVISFL